MKRMVIGILIVILVISMVGCGTKKVDPLEMCENAYSALANRDHIHFTLEQSMEASDGSYNAFESHERWYSGNNWLQVTDKETFEFSLLQYEGVQYSHYSNDTNGWQIVENPASLLPTWKAVSWEDVSAEVISDTETSAGREIVCSVKNDEMQDAHYIFIFDDTENLISLTVSGTTPMSDTVSIHAEFKHIVYDTGKTEIDQRILSAKNQTE